MDMFNVLYRLLVLFFKLLFVLSKVVVVSSALKFKM